MNPDEDVGSPHAENRRILKVRLPQQQVIRLHEMRILQSTSIATLLEHILQEYFEAHPVPQGDVTTLSGSLDEPPRALGLDDGAGLLGH